MHIQKITAYKIRLRRVALAALILCFFISFAALTLRSAGPGGLAYAAASDPHLDWTKYDSSEAEGLGDGAQAAPYLIGNAVQLKDLANKVNGAEPYDGAADDMSGKHIRLTADIMLPAYGTSSQWEPIGNYSSSDPDRVFCGSLDGGGYTVSGLFNDGSTYNYVGLFGYISGGDVSNLNVCGVIINESGYYAGGIAGYIDGGSITGCSYNGSLTGCAIYSTGNSCVGGIAGGAYNAVITGCSVSGTITGVAISSHPICLGGIVGKGGKNNIISCDNKARIAVTGYYYTSTTQYTAGGIIGYIDIAGLITGCRNEGAVTATDGTVCAGGIAGYSVDGSAIKSSYNVADVTTITSGVNYTGGIAGRFGGDITDCRNEGAVTATGSQVYAGGIIGDASYSTVLDSRNEGAVTATGTGMTEVGGIIGNAYDGQVMYSYNTGMITTNCKTYIFNTGGIIGLWKTSSYSVILASYNTGGINVKGSGYASYTGGIAGNLDATEKQHIINSYNAGNINIIFSGVVEAGGITSSNRCNIDTSYNTGEIRVEKNSSNYGFVGGITGRVATGKVIMSYSAGELIATGANMAAGGITGSLNGGGTDSIIYSYFDAEKFTGDAVGDDPDALPLAGLTTRQMTADDTLTTGGMRGLGLMFLKRPADTATGVIYYPELMSLAHSSNPADADASRLSVAIGATASDRAIYKITYDYREATGGGARFDLAEDGYDFTLNVPVRTGYKFSGWYDADAEQYITSADGRRLNWSAGDKTVYARWDAEVYGITYDTGIADGAVAAEAYTTEEDTPLLAAPLRPGYTFFGWYDNPELEGDAIEYIAAGSVGDRTFYAGWEIVKYRITYFGTRDAANGNPAEYTAESEIRLAPLTRAGYAFSGWYDNFDFEGDAIEYIAQGSLGDRTLCAKWNAVEYTITYAGIRDAEGYSPAVYTTEKEIRLAPPMREGYAFLGWYDNFDLEGDAIEYIAEGSLGDRTFYAKWSARAAIGGGENIVSDAADGAASGIDWLFLLLAIPNLLLLFIAIAVYRIKRRARLEATWIEARWIEAREEQAAIEARPAALLAAPTRDGAGARVPRKE
jgi:uncharacterized repeat protein (TIGR02543 family)